MRWTARSVTVLAMASLCTMPLAAAAQAASNHKKSRPSPSISLANVPTGILGFTPAAADPKLAASLGQGGGEHVFRFTPSGKPGSRKSVTVAVRSRGVTHSEAVQNAAPGTEATAPSTYNLGVSIGWSRFALSGGYSKLDTGLAPFGRESVDVGLSYLGKNWRGTLQLGADNNDDSQTAMLNREHSYSVDLGGAYALSRNLSLSGGLRYKRDENLGITLDNKRDSQSVYVGTSFSF